MVAEIVAPFILTKPELDLTHYYCRLQMLGRFLPTYSPLSFVRGLKTHKGAASRWWKNGSGDFVRKQAGRRHGNVGWSRARILRHLNGSVTAANTKRHKKLNVLMPFAK